MKNARQPKTRSASAQEQRQFTSASTSGEAQRQRIIAALRVSPQSSYDLRRMGCYQAPARINELRRKGYIITTDRITITDRDGYQHSGCALYTLEGVPSTTRQPQEPQPSQSHHAKEYLS